MRQSLDEGEEDATPLILVEEFEAAAQRAGFRSPLDARDGIGLEQTIAKRGVIGQHFAAELRAASSAR